MNRRAFYLIAIFFSMSAILFAQTNWHGSGYQGAVSAGGAESVEAGMQILKKGGNAVDAAAATLLALTVTDSHLYCFGGEIPIMVYDAKRKVVEVISGQGVAPRLATLQYFQNKNYETMPGSGIEPAAVPAVLDAITTALDRYGTLTFSDIAEPTLKILSTRDKQWHKDLAVTLQRLINAEKSAPSDRKRGLRMVANYFYRGPIAREINKWSRENGGLLRYTDLATHVTRIEEPLKIDYRGLTIYKCDSWTQGPYLLQALQLLKPYDISAMQHNCADYIHLVTEALKLSLADRDEYYADRLFVDVPLEKLISKEYADIRRKLVDMDKASAKFQPGDPHNMKAILTNSKIPSKKVKSSSRDTTTCVTADRWGNVVAATPSGWGGVVAGKTGVFLGTRLQSLNLWPGHPNCIEPGKRPRTTLTPTIVLKDDRPIIVISVAGGDMQDQVTLQLLLNTIEFGLTPAQAVTKPRFGTEHRVGSFRQPPPELGSLIVNPLAQPIIDELKSKGHRIRQVDKIAKPSIITIDPKTNLIRSAGDPNTDGNAAAF